MQKVKWALLGLVLAGLVVVVFRNLEETSVELVFTTVTLPLAALLTITLAIGFVLGMSVSALWKVRSWRHRSKAGKSKVESSESDV